MGRRNSIDSQERGFYFSKTGQSDFDGTSFERPKSTMQEAINAANALSPPPAGDALAVISSAQGGSFSAGFVLEDFIQFNGMNVSITENSAVAVELASFLDCSVTSVSNSFAAGVCFNIDGKQFVRVECGLINVTGTGGAKAINIIGTCDNLFSDISQITLVSAASIGIDITSTHATPIDFNIDTVSMDGDNTIFCNYNPVSVSDECSINVSTITSNGSTGSQVFIVDEGHLAVRSEVIQADTIIHVKSGAEADLTVLSAAGDIIVDAGGVLNIAILDYESGTVTNNGTINGVIGSDRYGDLNVLDSLTIQGDLTVLGTTTTIDTENISVADSYIDLNAGYALQVAKTGGLVVNCEATATADTVSSGDFTAGVSPTSNPTVQTVGFGTFSQGDIIQISVSTSNNGIFEVEDHTGNLLTVRGIGTVGTVEDFSRNQFVTETGNAVITKIIVCVMRANTSGLWEEGTGSTTPIVYNVLSEAIPGGSDTQIQFNNGGVFGGISGITTDGINLDVSGRIDGAGTGGLLHLRAGANSPIGGEVKLEGGGASTTGGKVQLQGGLGNSNGGNIELFGGEGPNNKGGSVIATGGLGGTDDGSGAGGDIVLTGGTGGFDTGAAGDITLTGGNGNINGGDVVVTGGVGTTSEGGTVFVAGGASTGSAGGTIDLTAGTAGTTGAGGNIVLLSGAASGSGEDSGAITIDAGITVSGNVGDILMARATGRVGIGVSTVVPSAELEVSSASRGFLMPRMTTAEKLNISSPATGLEVFDITLNAPFFFDGTDWSGTAGNETLAQTLANGNTTGGTSLSISPGDFIISPDGVGTASGGELKLDAGDGGLTSGAGGEVSIVSGSGRGGNANSGGITIEAGSPNGSGSFGNLNLQSDGGNVGIGVVLQNPTTLLEMQGTNPVLTIQPTADFEQSEIRLLGSRNLGASNADVAQVSGFNFKSGSAVRTSMIAFTNGLSGTSAGALVMHTKSEAGTLDPRLLIDDFGNVGIGTVTPSARLTVKEDSSNVATNTASTILNEDTTASNWAELEFSTLSSTASEVTGVRLGAQYLDHTDASIDADFVIKTTHNNILSERFRISDGVINVVTGSLNINQGNIISPDGTSGVAINIVAGAGSSGNGGNLDLTSGQGFGAGGEVNLTAGDGAFAGGTININSGDASSSNSSGGLISLQSGSSSGTTSGGQLHVFGGIGGDNSGTGGQVLVHAGGGGNSQGDGGLLSLEGGQGFSTGNTDGGDVDIQGGTNFGTGIHGDVLLQRTAGNVGIGTATPETLLHMLGTNPILKIKGAANFEQAELQLHGSRDQNGADLALIRAFNFRTGSEVETSRISSAPQTGTDSGNLKFFTKSTGNTLAETMRIDVDGVLTSRGIEVSRIGVTVVEIFTAADLDALATAGVITVDSDLQLIFKDDVVTSNRFVTAGFTLRMGGAGSSFTLTYTGTGDFLSGTGRITIRSGVTLQSASTGTLWNIDQPSNALVIHQDSNWINWDDHGTIKGGIVSFQTLNLVLWSGPLVFDSNEFVNIETIGTLFAPSSGHMFEVRNQEQEGSILRFNNVTADLTGTTTTIYKVDPAILASTQMAVISGTVIDGGGNFDTSGITGTFASVFDVTVALTTIDSVTNSSGVARFNFTVGPTLFVNQEVDIVNFVTQTNYNQTGIITATGAGFFEVASIAFTADDATGDFSSNSVQMFETATALVDGDTLVIDTNAGTEYDGGATVYGKDANTFRINRVFSITTSGTWNTAGIDQTDPRVLSFLQQTQANSHIIAAAFVNNNSTVNPAIVNNTFSDMAFGTGGGGLVEGSNQERWKLIDPIVGIFEYTGNEPFAGFLNYSFTSVSTGGTQEFRFRFVKDTGSGFVVLPDDVESLVEIGGTASSTTKTQPLDMNKGDQIKPQVTRNAGTSTVTTSYATINAIAGV